MAKLAKEKRERFAMEKDKSSSLVGTTMQGNLMQAMGASRLNLFSSNEPLSTLSAVGRGTMNKNNKFLKHQVLPMEIFNLLEFLRLVSICCAGKSGEAEQIAQTKIMTFPMSYKLYTMVGNTINPEKGQSQFWPLKSAILVYVWNTFLDSDDKEFLKPVEATKMEN